MKGTKKKNYKYFYVYEFSSAENVYSTLWRTHRLNEHEDHTFNSIYAYHTRISAEWFFGSL